MVKKTTPSEESPDDCQTTEPNTGSIRTVPSHSSSSVAYSRAFAARIGERDLWIANSGAVTPENLATLDLSPEFVVSVNRTATDATTDHHPLKDAYVNDQQQFTEVIETTRRRIQQDGTVIVNCAAGISRSTTVIATAVAAEEKEPFDTIVEEVRQTRSRADPHPKLQLSAQAYLATIIGLSEAHQRLKELADSVYPGCEEEETVETLLAATPSTDTPSSTADDHGGVSDEQ